MAGSVVDELNRLVKLRDEGVLSPEEFEIAKARILGTAASGDPPPPPPASPGHVHASPPPPPAATGTGSGAQSSSDALIGVLGTMLGAVILFLLFFAKPTSLGPVLFLLAIPAVPLAIAIQARKQGNARLATIVSWVGIALAAGFLFLMWDMSMHPIGGGIRF